ncbi:MAG: peptidyl-prolyl cis-trans isomerase [Deltaproteobacteria bacterium]|nr:peptidyl-prolyl cis-trans isomerase [Deltaproteobacteria bacterium]
MRPGAILRAPLAHFLLGGVLLFAASALLGGADTPPRPRAVAIDAARVEEIRDETTTRSGRAPTRAELERQVALELDEELLYREALARGLDAGDPGIEARLVQKMLFLDEEASPTDAPALVERARALGLDRDDVVIRRLLAEKLRLVATTLAPEERPDEELLRSAFRERSERLTTPARIRFLHVFLSQDRRGTDTPSAAEALARKLEAERIAPTDAIRLGDPFPGGHAFSARTSAEIARQLGRDFAERVAALPVGEWSEPIGSAYGLHLVYVDGVRPGELPAFEQVRERLRLELESALRERKLAALLAELRTRYEVAVAWTGEEEQ